MDDVGLPTEALQSLKHPSTEEDKSFVVILIILSSDWALVDAVPSEVVQVVKEIDLNLLFQVTDERRFDVRELGLVANRNGNFFEADNVVEFVASFADEPVAGHHDADFMPELLNCLR